MNIFSHKLKNSIAINALKLPTLVGTDELKSSIPKHVFIEVDVSYSMNRDLPQLRTQLKNKLVELVGPEDLVTIIWFSGPGQAGILKEATKVSNLEDLQKLNEAIDRFLVPVGMTSFLDPLKLTESLIEKYNTPNTLFSFIFLTDGYNNSSPWNEIIKCLERLEVNLASAAFIEYGYYANSAGLTEMAETVGGVKVFSKNFEDYEVEFPKLFSKVVETRRVVDLTDIQKKLNYGFVFTVDSQSNIIAYSVKSKTEIHVPADTEYVYFFSQKGFAEGEKTTFDDRVLYASAFILADRLKYQRVEEILTNLGDKYLIKVYSGAYGKQKLNDFKQITLDCVADYEGCRYLEGKDESYTPDPNRFCVMDLIDELGSDEKNEFLPYHPEFNYERIGKKSITKAELSDDQKEELMNAKTKNQADKVLASIEVPEFIYPENKETLGSPFTGLVWNEDRANLSVRTKVNGKVKVPTNKFGLTEVDSYIYRNYTFIKDGILNITQIPVRLSDESRDRLLQVEDITILPLKEDIYLLDFSALPIINRSMTTNISAKKLSKLQLELLVNQAQTKYLKELNVIFSPKTNVESAKKYTVEAAEWLKEIGVTDFNGFSPKKELVASGDVYIGVELLVKIGGFSSLPKTSDAIAKMVQIDKDGEDKVKVTPSIGLMIKSIRKVGVLPTDTPSNEIKTLLLKLGKEIETEKRELMSEIAQIKFGLILSRTWFKEFETMDDCEITVPFPKVQDKVKVKFEYHDKEIAV